MANVLILEPCMVQGVPVQVGEIIDLDGQHLSHVLSARRGILTTDAPAEVAEREPIAMEEVAKEKATRKAK